MEKNEHLISCSLHGELSGKERAGLDVRVNSDLVHESWKKRKPPLDSKIVCDRPYVLLTNFANHLFFCFSIQLKPLVPPCMVKKMRNPLGSILGELVGFLCFSSC